jgi:TolB-like protein/tetratricopeptide (TPR) repeat protein
MSQPDLYQKLLFGDFELDLPAYELRRRGKTIAIERRPMDLLILLVERRQQLVSREDIVERLWGPGVFVDVETGVNTAVRKVRQALGDSPDSPAYVETVSRKGYRFIAQVTIKVDATVQRPQPSYPRIMLAVLPFEDLSGDAAQNYFSDGLTEETISYLGRIDPERMGVIARTTSMAYKGTRKSVREIGAELGVDYVLESSVRREGNRVRITSQLIRVKDQTHIWASTYDREVTGVLSIQQEIGTAIAGRVELQLSPHRVAAMASQQTPSAEAHDLYLRGRYFWNQLSPPTTQRAIEYFTRATEMDPHYALPWSGLADTYATSPVNGDAPPLQVWPKGREAAAQAVRAAPELAETQTSLGFVRFWLDWEWLAAESAFRKAITLNPSYALAHRMLGIVLSHLGQAEESLAAVKRARELDPLNASHQALSSQIAFAAHDYATAVQFARQAIAIDPEFWIGYIQLGQAYEQLANPELALDALTQAGRLSGGNSKTIAIRGYILGKQGKIKEALDILNALEAVAGDRYIPPYAIALIHTGLGQHEIALERLERAIDTHDVHLSFLPYDPKWDELRSDPRFARILDRCAFAKPASPTSLSMSTG